MNSLEQLEQRPFLESKAQEILSELKEMLSDTADTDPQSKRIEQFLESVQKQLAKISGG